MHINASKNTRILQHIYYLNFNFMAHIKYDFNYISNPRFCLGLHRTFVVSAEISAMKKKNFVVAAPFDVVVYLAADSKQHRKSNIPASHFSKILQPPYFYYSPRHYFYPSMNYFYTFLSTSI